MGRILLTPSQVSVLITGSIITLCTVALFLSGYIIQQRTLRELRASIRPREARPSPKIYTPELFKQQYREQYDEVPQIQVQQQEEHSAPQDVVVEVIPTEPEPEHQDPVAAPVRHVPELPANDAATQKKLAMMDEIKKKAEEQAWGVEHPDPLAKSKIPITRAERRRLIKEEIQRLAHSEKKTYYQRRLW